MCACGFNSPGLQIQKTKKKKNQAELNFLSWDFFFLALLFQILYSCRNMVGVNDVGAKDDSIDESASSLKQNPSQMVGMENGSSLKVWCLHRKTREVSGGWLGVVIDDVCIPRYFGVWHRNLKNVNSTLSFVKHWEGSFTRDANISSILENE